MAPTGTGAGANALIQSPDYPTPTPGSTLPAKGASNAQSSGGYEGFTIWPDKSTIYAVLEKSLTGDNPLRRVIAVFDPTIGQFTNKEFYYRVGDPSGNNNGIDPANDSIGDVVAINDHQILMLERDQNQGPASRFKRVYLVDLNVVDANGFVQKTLVADLLNIADPNGLGGNGTTNGVFTFPFITIEDIIPINNTTILVGNDNNYPFSTGRTANLPDNNELALIQLDTPIQLDPSLTQSVSVPEPVSLAVFGLSLAGLLASRGYRVGRNSRRIATARPR